MDTGNTRLIDSPQFKKLYSRYSMRKSRATRKYKRGQKLSLKETLALSSNPHKMALTELNRILEQQRKINLYTKSIPIETPKHNREFQDKESREYLLVEGKDGSYIPILTNVVNPKQKKKVVNGWQNYNWE